MINDIKKDTKIRMDKCVHAFAANLNKIRTGRAHPSLLEHLTVDYYGSQVPLSQTANIAVEDSRTLTIQPWEKTMVAVIEKAIMNSDLGLTPASAGTLIRVPLPALTEDRRKSLARLVKQEAEQGRIAVRNVRRDAMSDVRELLKEKEITEDDERRAETEIQQVTDGHVARIDQLSEEKQQEIMDF